MEKVKFICADYSMKDESFGVTYEYETEYERSLVTYHIPMKFETILMPDDYVYEDKSMYVDFFDENGSLVTTITIHEPLEAERYRTEREVLERKVVSMTKEENEKKLGYKINIVE